MKSSIASIRSAFTLIELLIVIGVIALVVALLAPAVTAARREAVASRCLSNLRSYGVSTQMYANDFDGWILRSADVRSSTGYFSQPWFVMVRRDFGGLDSVSLVFAADASDELQCPADSNTFRIAGYVANSFGRPQEGDFIEEVSMSKVTDIRRSSASIFLADRSDGLPHRPDADAKLFAPSWLIEMRAFHFRHLPGWSPQSEATIAESRHGEGRVAVSKFDGSGQLTRSRFLTASDFRDGSTQGTGVYSIMTKRSIGL